MSVVGCIAQDLIKSATTGVLSEGFNILVGLFAGAEEAGPPPPKPAVTVTHQIKHKSFLLALAGAVVGAVLTVGITAALGVTTFGAGLAVGIVVGAAVSYGVGKAVDWLDSKLPANHGPVLPPSSPNVKVRALAAARAGIDTVGCTRHSTPPLIAEGSKTVRVNGWPLARIDDKTACGATLKQGVETVLVGGEKDQVVEIGEEFLGWQRALIVAVDFLVPPSKGVKGLFKIFKFNGLKNGLKALSKSFSRAFKKAYTAAANAFKHLKSGQFRKFGQALRGLVTGMCKSNSNQRDKNNKKRTNSDDSGASKPAKNPTCKAGCPVYTATGAVVETRHDFTVGNSMRLVFTREYDSRSEVAGLFGRGWMDSFSEHLAVSFEAEHFEFRCVSGEVIHFDIATGTDRVANRRFPHFTLIREADGVAIHDLRDDRTRHFELVGDRGRLVALVDSHGNRMDFTYHGDELVAAQHSDGHTLRLRRVHDHESDHSALIIERVDHGGTRVLAHYTLQRELLTAAETVHSTLYYQYDAHQRLTRWADSSRTWATYEYDARGRCVRSRASDGLYSIDLEYDDAASTTCVRDGKGRLTSYEFDHNEQLIRLTDPLGHARSWTYDRHGRLVLEIDAVGNTTRRDYDPASGLVARTTDPAGGVTEFNYDGALRPVTIVDAAGQVWTYQRDARGAVTAIVAPDDSTYRYTYNDRGQTTVITRPDGRARALSYDAYNRLAEETDWRGQVHSYTYDPHDRLIAARDLQGRVESFFYDPRDRLTSLRHPDGHQRGYEYDSEHNLVALADENGHTARAEYGAFDLHRATIDPEGRRYELSYDPDHLLLTEVRAPDGRRYRLERDAAGRVSRETDYHGAITHYKHDAAGRVIERRGAAGQHIHYRYDACDRLIAIEADGERTAFEYDSVGRLVRAANPTTTLEWTYDALGRVVHALQDGDHLEYAYDEAGRCVERSLRAGLWQRVPHTTRFAHDDGGRLTELQLPSATLEIDRDERGLPTRLRAPEGFRLDQDYDVRGSLSVQRLAPTSPARPSFAGPAGAQLSRGYTYDPAQNPREIVDARWGTTRFRYDASDRPLVADRPGPAGESFRYSPAGLLSAANRSGQPAPFDFSPSGRLHRSGDIQYTYDDAGRLIARTVHRKGFRPARWTFTWDSLDRLVSATTPDGQTWRYTYDPLGRRVRKFNPSTRHAVLYLWDGDVLLREIHLQPRGPAHDQQAVQIVHWHHEPGTFRPLAREEDGQAHFVVTDHLGTPRELVAPDGTITWRGRHTTWGGLLPDSEADPTTCPIRFQGHYEDPETGLHYNRFRYYDPDTALYLSPDPIGLDGGLQPAAYVHNPNSWIDPLGLEGCESVNSGSALRTKLKALQDAQAGAATTKMLPDGRIRYYGPETAASKPGPTRGASYVTEYNPKTGSVRSWMESYDHAGNVNRVHPKMINGQTVNSQHYPPTARELGQ